MSLLGGVFAVGLGLWIALVDLPKRSALYSDQARVGPAVIADKAIRPGRQYTDYLVLVHYRDAGGTPHETTNMLHRRDWEAVRPPQRTTVRYLAAKPEYAFVAGAKGGQPLETEDRLVPLLFLSMGAALLVLRFRFLP